MQNDLFANLRNAQGSSESIASGAIILRTFVTLQVPDLVRAVTEIDIAAPFRRMSTPGGRQMSVAMTNCGPLGWVSDKRGYRYSPTDPDTAQPWPPMPPLFLDLARHAAETAGFPNFLPDACLINRYQPGTRMGLHQDKDETDLEAPIVSVSIGLPAVFQFGGATRKDPTTRYRLESGDVVVWGGPSRLHYHGVATIADGIHPVTGSYRLNLTFRKTR